MELSYSGSGLIHASRLAGRSSGAWLDHADAAIYLSVHQRVRKRAAAHPGDDRRTTSGGIHILVYGCHETGRQVCKKRPDLGQGGNPSRCADNRYSGTAGRRQPAADGSRSDAGRNFAFGILKLLALLREEEREI
ncbi:hypothetical protein SDC9_129173 [bioreactor metagenome]|uniref:Uncharacterized protein n=1 Tax=bioreactor metagenome TaxID=1076179 RepID=A0A645CZ18_9ZZZZ